MITKHVLVFLLGTLYSPLLYSAENPIPHEEIVILGGGMSGLTSAYELHKKGIFPALYEGRDRLGGRTWTHYFDKEQNIYFEEGGTFIDADHIATIAMAGELGVTLKKRGFGSRNISLIQEGKLVPTEEFEPAIKELLAEITKINTGLLQGEIPATALKNEEEYYAPLVDFLKTSPLSKLSKDFIETFYTDEMGIPLDKAPVTEVEFLIKMFERYEEFLHLKNSDSDPQALKEIDEKSYIWTVEKGMSHFIEALEKSIKEKVQIHLGHKLIKIDRKKEGPFILTFDTQKQLKQITASSIIMTLPFSTLRDVDITQNVPLSNLTHQTIQELPYGMGSKVGFTALGAKNIYDDLSYYIDTDEKIIGWPGEQAMTLLITGNKGKNLDSTSPLLGQMRSKIAKEYPYTYGEPILKNWTTDPFSKGTYSAITTDVNAKLFRINYVAGSNEYAQYIKYGYELYPFAYPISVGNGGYFIFAGEHTRVDETDGHIEGAVRSGILAAKIIGC